MLELDTCDMAAYLRARGLLDPHETVTVSSLGGGISNIVLRVTAPRIDAVVKQALSRLRVKDDWPSRIDRVFVEKACLETLAALLGGQHAPRVLFEDRDNYLFAMEYAPEGSVVWKAHLMAGQVDAAVARQVGRLLGTLHTASREDKAIARRFADQEVYDQLRLDPYYRTTAARHPDLAGAFARQLERMARTRTALVHGDYSPKNLLLLPNGMVWIVDCEVAHWGDPTFDLAFCLNHLFLKRVHNAQWAGAYLAAVDAFWQGYRETGGREAGTLEQDTVSQLGCLMLARIDGKSPVEYIVDPAEKETVRRISRRILRDPAIRTLADVAALVDEEAGR